MATEKILHNLRSFCLGENRPEELEVEIALLDINVFDHESKNPDEKHRDHDPSLTRIGKALARVFSGNLKSLLGAFTGLVEVFQNIASNNLSNFMARRTARCRCPLRLLPPFPTDLASKPSTRLGSGPDAYHIMQLPLLRIIYSGSALVSIFFVISGYMLSTKPLRLAREQKTEGLLANLASSTFRRGPRLFIPCIVSTFITAMLAMMGAFADEGVARHYPQAGSLSEQMASWVHETLRFINPFATRTGFEENLWTIPIEF
ncbi:MAG: hypothetical protein Q9184_006358 [Pyrenodesmia sp. 2 TL-2023]